MFSMPVTLRDVNSREARECGGGTPRPEDKVDIISEVPFEIALLIFGNLHDPIDLANCSKVSEKWHELANDNVLWRGFIEDKKIVIPADISVKKFIAEQCPVPGAIFCRSHDEAIQKLEAFFRNYPYDLWGSV